MTEQYIIWALVVGIVVGAALYWFALGRLPRTTDDVTPAERVAEAGWISRAIENRGGVAPTDLVEEVLDMHSAYLSGPALEEPDEATTTQDDVAPAASASRPEGAPQGS